MSVHELKALGQRDIWVWTLNICSQVACIWGQTEVPLAYMNANWFHVMRRLLFQRCFQIRCSDTDANEVLCGYQSHTHTQDSDGFYSSYAFSFRQYKRYNRCNGTSHCNLNSASFCKIFLKQENILSSFNKSSSIHASFHHPPSANHAYHACGTLWELLKS